MSKGERQKPWEKALFALEIIFVSLVFFIWPLWGWGQQLWNWIQGL